MPDDGTAGGGGGGGGPEPVRVRLVHVTDGRARLRLARAAGREAMLALAERLGGIGGVARVAVRPNTGSVIVEAGLDREALEAALSGSDAIRILPPDPPIQVGAAAQLGLMKLDHDIREETEGALDLRTAMVVLLVGGAAIQLWRGQVAGPATTLLLGAFSLLEGRKG